MADYENPPGHWINRHPAENDMLMHAAEAAYEAERARQRPSVLYRPALYIDGNKWCALYGESLQDGVAGFGNSPEQAMAQFDREWAEPLKDRE